jgi:hypothetical protein
VTTPTFLRKVDEGGALLLAPSLAPPPDAHARSRSTGRNARSLEIDLHIGIRPLTRLK